MEPAHHHPSSNPMYSYVRDVERENDRLRYIINRLEDKIARQELPFSLNIHEVKDISLAKETYTPVYKFNTYHDQANGIPDYAVNCEIHTRVTLTLVLDDYRLGELKSKLHP